MEKNKNVVEDIDLKAELDKICESFVSVLVDLNEATKK